MSNILNEDTTYLQVLDGLYFLAYVVIIHPMIEITGVLAKGIKKSRDHMKS